MAKQRGGLGRGFGSIFTTNETSNKKVEEHINATAQEEKVEKLPIKESEPVIEEKPEEKPQEVVEVSRETPEMSSQNDNIVVPATNESSMGEEVIVQGEVDKTEKEAGESANAPSQKTSHPVQTEEAIAFEVAIDKVEPNPDQPRTQFKSSELEELAESIKKDGLINPIVVRKVGKKYQIVAGERRWQASKKAKLKKVLVHLIEADDNKSLELALIENLQRSDLNPIEEAYGYKRLMERTQKSQTQIAEVVSKGRSTITNALRLLDLPEHAQKLLFENKITAGHARAILSVPTPEGREKLTEKLASQKLSVREAENLARLMSGRQNKGELKTRVPLPETYVTTAKALSRDLGTKVKVKSSARGKNKLEIEFADAEDLKRIVANMRTLVDEQEG